MGDQVGLRRIGLALSRVTVLVAVIAVLSVASNIAP
jgi:hypothetical protein